MRHIILAGIVLLAAVALSEQGGAGERETRAGDNHSSTAAKGAVTLKRFEFAQVHMGTHFRILLYAESENAANIAGTAALKRIEQLDEKLSDYKHESELSRLSRSSPTEKPIAVSDDLWNVLSRGQRLARQTDGAFDVTIGPHSRLWRRARRRKELPPDEMLNKAKAAVGYRHLQLDSCQQTAELKVANMRLDLGAIAKGYAADEALLVLRDHGITSALIDAAGDIVCSDAPPNKPGWKVAIASLQRTQTEDQNSADEKENTFQPHYLTVHNTSIATSGDLYQHLEIDGRRYSHIIDPRTGLGIAGQTSVTIVASDGMTTDSLASAISVLGVDQGFKLLKEMPSVACRFAWIDEQGEIQTRTTDNFSRP